MNSLFQIRTGVDVKAAVGLADCPIINSPADVAAVFGNAFENLEREAMICLHLDCKLHLIRWTLLNVGSQTCVMIRIGDVFRDAISCGAMGVILVHNHPSGSLESSKEDYDFTLRVQRAGHLLGYTVFDHVVVTANGYRSILPSRYTTHQSTIQTYKPLPADTSETCALAAQPNNLTPSW